MNSTGFKVIAIVIWVLGAFGGIVSGGLGLGWVIPIGIWIGTALTGAVFSFFSSVLDHLERMHNIARLDFCGHSWL